MTPVQLRDTAAEALSLGLSRITLTVPAKGRRPGDFPRGELLCVNQPGDRSYSVSCARILAWVAKHRLA
jgi:hypothetical protein